MTLPVLSIIFLTYASSPERTTYALRTIRAAQDKLRYDGELTWLVADDGSNSDHWEAVTSLAEPLHPSSFQLDRAGYGAIANKAWVRSFDVSPVTLWLEDDWVLQDDFDITPYVLLLLEDDHVGLVRVAHLPDGLTLHSERRMDRLYLNIPKDQMYAFSGNPHLKHKRFGDHYGYYPVGENPGETELIYGAAMRGNGQGPEMVWPLETAQYGDWGVWGHIGTVQSYEA